MDITILQLMDMTLSEFEKDVLKTYAPNSTLDLFKDFENGKEPMVKLAHLYEDQNGRVFIDGEYIDPNTKESFKDSSPSNMYGILNQR